MPQPRSRATAVPAAVQLLARELAFGAQAAASPFAAVRQPELLQMSGSGHQSAVAPVVLVHGYASRQQVWQPLLHRLRAAGFTDLHCLSYGCAGHTVARLATELAQRTSAALGGEPAHLIGHSLGGVLIRFAVERLRLPARSVTLIATPNRGARLAYLGLGPLAAELRPGSAPLRMLADPVDRLRAPWTAYYSRSDLVVPPHSAVLEGDATFVSNVHIDGQGHLSIVRSPALAEDLLIRLCRHDRPADAGLADALAS